jgi:hypothetical protein
MKIKTSAASPSTNRIIGRIASLPPLQDPCSIPAAKPPVRSEALGLDFSHKPITFRPSIKEGGPEMNLSPPTVLVFVISLILAVLAIIGNFVAIPFITQYDFWVAIVAYVILAIGVIFRGV